MKPPEVLETQLTNRRTSEVMMKAFASRRDGKCKICFRGFKKGTEIVWDRTRKGVVAHESCYKERGWLQHESGWLQYETEKNEMQTQPVTTYEQEKNEMQTQPGLAALIAASVAPFIKPTLDRDQILELVNARLAEMDFSAQVKQIEIKHPDKIETTNIGAQHEKFETLLKACSARDVKGSRLNFWLAGPAGTGKSTAAENVGKALGFERIVLLPKLSESYTFFGHHSPGTGEYKRTPARDVWEFGGCLILDDFDGTDPNVATELNAPLANCRCMFPDGMVPRHPDCLIILTANTWGFGATNEYVGRVKQDASFMNRFVPVSWPIDEKLELATSGNVAWTKRVQKIRANVKAKGIKVLITPRQSYFGAALLAAGLEWPEVEEMVLQGAMTADQWQAVQ